MPGLLSGGAGAGAGAAGGTILVGDGAGLQLGFYEQALRNVAVLLVLAAFDLAVARRTKARWFALHAFGNLLVVLTGLRSLLTCLMDPYSCCDSRVYNDESMFGTASKWPVIATNSLHLYHCLAFSLSADELFHHALFIPTIGAMGQYFSWGALQGAIGTQLSGLPGGIDYVMLVLVKHGRVSVMAQKRLSASLNNYLRGPVITVLSFILFQSYVYSRNTVPLVVGALVGGTAAFNALYYTKSAIANFALAHALDLLKVSNDLPEAALKSKALKEPQQSMS